jgi:hypothetical protein
LGPQAVDQFQDAAEQVPGHRNLGHLEDDVPGMSHDLGADLHQPLAQRGQRPVGDLSRQRQGAQEVAEIVGQRVQLEANGVGAEAVA